MKYALQVQAAMNRLDQNLLALNRLIKEGKQTIVIVSLDSSSLGSTQTTDQHINNINSIGNITLKI